MAQDFSIDTNFEVNIDAVTAGSARIASLVDREAFRLRRGLASLAHQLLADNFSEAVRDADSNGGFPPEFQEHVMESLDNIEIDVAIAAGTAFVTVDFDALGTREDLEKAFHQGAKLAEGGFVDGPYNGEQLANESAAERHEFWEAVRGGATKIANPKGTGSIPIKAGAWDATKQKYIQIWGNQAPEWLYVQFGQDQWSPKVPAQDVIGKFAFDMQRAFGAYLADVLEEEIRIANSYQTLGADVGFTSRGSVQVKDKPITINGKTYKPGQFVPKNIG